MPDRLVYYNGEPGKGFKAAEREMVWDTPLNNNGVFLVVEDEDDLRSLYSEGLGLIAGEVLQARDGQEGWEIFQANADRISAVISDIFMPRMNGIELLNRIKELHPETRVVLVTGYAHRHRHQLENECTMPPDAFLEKPFHLSRLLKIISEILQGNNGFHP